MTRPAVPLLLCIAALSAQTPASPGSRDPVFNRIPFDSWFTSSEQAHIKWSVDIPDVTLSPHQRLSGSVKLKVDGVDLAARRGKGQLGMLIQLRDANGALWQTHDAVDLTHLQDSVAANEIEYVQPFFVLPGDYEVSVAMVDTATGEHVAARRKLHVAGLKSEPLADAWRDLPAVEYLHPSNPPDSWYLPAVKSKVRLTAHARRPVTVDLLVNLTPTERLSGTNKSRDRNLSLLLPALKVLAAADWGDAPLRVSLLDLANRRVTFDQEKVQTLDWEKAKGTLAEMAPGIIDVKALEDRKNSANFFVQQVGRRVEGPAGARPGTGPHRIVIVLSSPVAFEAGVERRPIEAEPGKDFSVFYFRYHAYMNSVSIASPLRPGGNRRNPFDDVVFHPAPAGSQDDHLVPLLKGIHPELFDVNSTEQFRKALASMLEEISNL
jgi:hypothetical protein